MARFYIVLACVAAIGVSTVFHVYAIAMGVGILAGTVYFFIGLSQNGGVVALRLQRDPGRPNDPSTSISMGLAVAGVAAASAGNPHFPAAYHAFYLACLIAGLVIATVKAWQYRNSPIVPVADEASPGGPGADESNKTR